MSLNLNVSENKMLFAAYTRLTADAWSRKVFNNQYSQPKKNMSCEDFIEKLNEKVSSNNGLARSLPQSQINISRINAKYNHNPEFERVVLKNIEQAYNLGLVDFDDHLISPEKTDVKEYSDLRHFNRRSTGVNIKC